MGDISCLRAGDKKVPLDIVRYQKRASAKCRSFVASFIGCNYAPPGWTIRFSFSSTLLNNELPVLPTRGFYYTRYLHFRAALLLSAMTLPRDKCGRRLFLPRRITRTIRIAITGYLHFSRRVMSKSLRHTACSLGRVTYEKKYII